MATDKNNKPDQNTQPTTTQGTQSGSQEYTKSKPSKRKHIKIYEFKIYSHQNDYSGDLQLLVTTTLRFKDIIEITGRAVNEARTQAEEYVRSIGAFGITVEDPKGIFNFYPAHRIAKIVYSKKGEEADERDPE